VIAALDSSWASGRSSPRIAFALLIVVGASVKPELAWHLADIANIFMAAPNLIGLILLSGLVAQLRNDYLTRHRTPAHPPDNAKSADR
jgi:AGCS family alanine or glycine:cation symporter